MMHRSRCNSRLFRSVLALGLVAVLAPRASAVSLRRQCRLACKDAIKACIASGGKRRRCHRETLQRCRTEGVAACAGAAPTPTTTTTLASTGGAGGMGGAVNACHPDSAKDMRGQMQVTVHFGSALGFTYDPACFIVSPGTQVTFSGEFDQHPLVGGDVSMGMKVPDPSSPIGGPTSNGTSKTVMLQTAGTFPFYCDIHALVGMKGAAFVEP
jgi:plastocyanin